MSSNSQYFYTLSHALYLVWRFQNTSTKTHITILTLYLYSPLYSPRGIDMAAQSGGSNWPRITKFTVSPVTCFFKPTGLPVG
jgi:hypothetical protein